ncbi:methyltransferase family protein [Nocardioides sp. Iso805N]|uniref:methyltransferase family protein n=1 Tax=Nocardioides sp. Iso805N TaxID=1283287 RepID=UPI00036D991E|nr:isoprenylcysteine carboxylmethyltransferase family protein [Nocardioides sp. Iso805N]
MTRRFASLVLSAAGWMAFNAVMLWTVAFLAGVVVPRTVDGPIRVARGAAIGIDLALVLLFALQHSVMARRPVKAWLRRRIPEQLERATYVLAADASLIVLLLLWQPWGGRVWDVGGTAAVLLWSVCALGWVLAAAATYAVDHLELTGLRQAGWGAPRPAMPANLTTTGLHALVRHPLMLGLLIAFWATPRMSSGHLLFAAATTAYIAVGLRFEERDLRRTFGSAYDDYAARVPALVPGIRSAWRVFGGRAAA